MRISRYLISGSASMMVLIIGVVAAVFLGSIVILTASQVENIWRTSAYDEALAVAEAGAQYYQWHLAHDPDDFQDGTSHSGPYVHDYKDPQGQVIGQYSLIVVPPENGSTLTTVTSTGYTLRQPNIKRTVQVKYGIASLAKYAFLHNSNVFFGSGVTVHGPVMSNGGIRQDGVNDSLMQSALSTYTCGRDMGCNPSQVKPAIWGNGGPSTLWLYPVPPTDFSSVSVSFNQIKTDAQNIGIYYGPSGSRGYHVVFRVENGVGMADIYRVTRTGTVRGMGADGNCTNLNEKIQRETFLESYNLTQKNIYFFEDTLWVEGTFKGRASIVAAKFPIDSNNLDIWINGSVTYAAKDGTNQLGIIAQHSIIFVKDVPENFELNAALIAQKGTVFRNSYHYPSCGNNGNAVRSMLTLYGSIISGSAAYWNYGTPPGSGFVTRTITHDNHLLFNPPPYFPVQSNTNYETVSWTEISNP